MSAPIDTDAVRLRIPFVNSETLSYETRALCDALDAARRERDELREVLGAVADVVCPGVSENVIDAVKHWTEHGPAAVVGREIAQLTQDRDTLARQLEWHRAQYSEYAPRRDALEALAAAVKAYRDADGEADAVMAALDGVEGVSRG